MEFLNKLGEKLSEAGKGVQETAKTQIEINKVNSSINSNEKNITMLLLELGEEYLELLRYNPNINNIHKVDKILELREENVMLKVTLNELKGVINCGDCGAACPVTNNCCSKCGGMLIRDWRG